MIHQEPPLHVRHAKFAVGILLPKDLGPAIAVHFDNRYLSAVFQGTDDVVSRGRLTADVQALAVIRIDPLGAVVIGECHRGKEHRRHDGNEQKGNDLFLHVFSPRSVF